MEKEFTIKQWAKDDRPREKLVIKGMQALSDAELIAILISTGTREESAVDVSKKVLKTAKNNLNELGRLSIKDLRKIKGIGEAKAVSIVAALELGRRRKDEHVEEKMKISTSRDVYNYFQPILCDHKHEEFWILLLNRSNKIIGRKKISEGGVSGTVVDPKIIFKHAIDELATSIVLCHNHPSGVVKPSQADMQLTQKFKEAGKVLDIGVLDHIIIGEKGYYSFADENVL